MVAVSVLPLFSTVLPCPLDRNSKRTPNTYNPNFPLPQCSSTEVLSIQSIDLLTPILPLRWYLSVVKLISFPAISLDPYAVSKLFHLKWGEARSFA